MACDQMSELAKALLQPSFSDSRTMARRHLPAVPPALMMVLTGFMCVSLIRDRKVWLAVLAGLLWAGQTGINTLPELASRLSRRVHNAQPVDETLVASYLLRDGYYPESYSEQTRYVGLLHHLEGIPQETKPFTIKRISLTRFYPGASGCHTRASQHAIVSVLSSLSTTYNCLVRPTRQFVCFTPAFIFCQLPRGPPLSA